MKKLLFLGMALLGAFGAASVGGVSASAENLYSDIADPTEFTHTNDIFQVHNYASYYFKNLTSNHGRNDKGSCSYVALAGLLSFWDTYWDDDVIDEDYDVTTALYSNALSLSLTSPGILHETFDGKSMTADEYYDQVESLSDKYFHLSLIRLAEENFNYYYEGNDLEPCGIQSSIQLYYILNEYLYNDRGFTTDDFQIERETCDVKTFTIAKIKAGYPVELLMKSSIPGRAGHAMVAYDYDEDTDAIYVHPGWDNYPTHVSLDDLGYDFFKEAICIVPKEAHSCTDNYIYTASGKTHCACEFKSIMHSYTDHYAKYNASRHKAYCSCGKYILQLHSTSGSYTRNGHTYSKCVDCGYVVDLGTTMTYSSK